MTPQEQQNARDDHRLTWGENWHAVGLYVYHNAVGERCAVIFDPSSELLDSHRIGEVGGISMARRFLKGLAKNKGRGAMEHTYLLRVPNPDGDCYSMTLLWLYYVAHHIKRHGRYDPTDGAHEPHLHVVLRP